MIIPINPNDNRNKSQVSPLKTSKSLSNDCFIISPDYPPEFFDGIGEGRANQGGRPQDLRGIPGIPQSPWLFQYWAMVLDDLTNIFQRGWNHQPGFNEKL